MTETTTWRFNRHYDDTDQVQPFYSAYLAVYDELTNAGAGAYNDSFKGRIAGIEGPDEDTAIYLLQGLRALNELNARIEQYLAEGGERLSELHETTKFASVVSYGFYVGGTGWTEWVDARIVPDPHTNQPKSVLPKGKRTNGHLLGGGYVLVKRTNS